VGLLGLGADDAGVLGIARGEVQVIDGAAADTGVEEDRHAE
jgi:hypothetical protein